MLELERAVTRVPYRVFTDPAVYQREMERIFLGATWNYVALEAEIPKSRDFKATFIGDVPILVTRGADGRVHAFENRCAHRGALICRESRGNRAAHQCAYHQWTYDLEGNLIGVPFRAGINGAGGYPADFDPAEHGLKKLRAETYSGLVFVSADPLVEPIADYIGPKIRPYVDRLFNKPVVVLGYTRQAVKANWKLYAENTRDPYHASLLHLFHTTFGIYRSSQAGGIVLDDHWRHSFLHAAKKSEEAETAAYKDANLRTYQPKYTLHDTSMLAVRKEFEQQYTNAILQIFPSLLIQQINNTLATRQIVPKGPSGYELIFTYFGYEDDDAELRAMRIDQANLVGPSGYISLEDGYATELVQQAINADSDGESFIELGGKEAGGSENLINEAAIRAFWTHYMKVMEL